MVPAKLPVPGRSANLDHSRTRASALAVVADAGCLDIFVSLLFLFFLPLSGGRPDID